MTTALKIIMIQFTITNLQHQQIYQMQLPSDPLNQAFFRNQPVLYSASIIYM